MHHSTLHYSILIGTLLGITALSHAQEPAKTPATSPATTSTNSSATTTATTITTTTTAQTPSSSDLVNADLLKKAKSNGYHTKVRKGQVYYCKETTEIGTHFSNEVCYDENQFVDALQRQQAMRDSMTNHACGGGGGGSCGGK